MSDMPDTLEELDCDCNDDYICVRCKSLATIEKLEGLIIKVQKIAASSPELLVTPYDGDDLEKLNYDMLEIADLTTPTTESKGDRS